MYKTGQCLAELSIQTLKHQKHHHTNSLVKSLIHHSTFKLLESLGAFLLLYAAVWELIITQILATIMTANTPKELVNFETCSNCKKGNVTGAATCEHCGASLTGGSQQSCYTMEHYPERKGCFPTCLVELVDVILLGFHAVLSSQSERIHSFMRCCLVLDMKN